MIDDNLFLEAIKNKNIPNFFRGEEIYYKRMQDWGCHSHGANFIEEVIPVLKSGKVSEDDFWNLFEIFIDDLKPAKEDLEHLLSNISSIKKLTADGRMPICDKIKKLHAIKTKLTILFPELITSKVIDELWIGRWSSIFSQLGAVDMSNLLDEIALLPK